MANKARYQRYVRVGPAVWALIRRGYANGLTAAVLSERFGPSKHTIHHHAQDEGWSKVDLLKQEAPPLPDAEPEDQGPPPETPRQAALAAVDRAARELTKGRTAGAAEFARLAEVLARVAERLEAAGDGERDSAREEGLEALKARVAELRRRHEAEGLLGG